MAPIGHMSYDINNTAKSVVSESRKLSMQKMKMYSEYRLIAVNDYSITVFWFSNDSKWKARGVVALPNISLYGDLVLLRREVCH